jgi:hypothetical protein
MPIANVPKNTSSLSMLTKYVFGGYGYSVYGVSLYGDTNTVSNVQKSTLPTYLQLQDGTSFLLQDGSYLQMQGGSGFLTVTNVPKN